MVWMLGPRMHGLWTHGPIDSGRLEFNDSYCLVLVHQGVQNVVNINLIWDNLIYF